MSLVRVSAVFWRRVLVASFKALHQAYSGQYHITIPAGAEDQWKEFLGELPQYDPTDKEGFTIDIPIERFDGNPPVEAQSLRVRYMGTASSRKDWNFPAQSTDAYPLWAPGRGVADEFDPQQLEYIMLIRDESGRFHARWQHGTADLPSPLGELLQGRESGVWQQGAL